MVKEKVSLEKLRLKILNFLNNRGFVFLIKTEDYIFDEFLKNELFEKNLLVNSDDQNEQNNSYEFKEIHTINEDFLKTLLEHFKNINNSNLSRVVYFLPKHIIYNFFDHGSVENFISSCIFISEEQEFLRPFIFKKSLHTILGKKITAPLNQYFSPYLENKKTSLSKLIFFASVYSFELLEITEANFIAKSELKLDEKFLEEKGNEFLSSLSKNLSLESIETLFRAFIFIEKDDFTLLKLSLEELSSFTLASADDLNKFIELAISPQFQILTKRETLYSFKILEYLSEWSDLKRWIKNEEFAIKQYNQLEALAHDYFEFSGTLLSKEQIEQALNWKAETIHLHAWEQKYKLDSGLISSYILLSQNNLEETLKKQQKKRSRLLKNSIRISIAVSIAFLLSSFTALIAYLERNSAIKQHELAILAKEEADQARKVAENERIQAIEARQNESSALEKAEVERLLALEARSQEEIQKKNALSALDKAKKSEMEASGAREIAERNEQLANEAREIAQVNFKTSERLRNQQEARSSALEAMGYFANEDYRKGIQLSQAAYEKNINNGGFPLQSDIFYALIYGKLNLEENQLEIDLEHPAKFLALSTSKDQLAVYTINGEIRIYATQPKFVLRKIIKTGYIQSMEFINGSQILFTSLDGNLLTIDIISDRPDLFNEKLSKSNNNELLKIPGKDNTWIATSQKGEVDLLNYQKTDGFFKIKEKSGFKIQAMDIERDQIAWAEGTKFFTSGIADENGKLLFTAPSEISSITWSQIHASWVAGLKSGQLVVIHPDPKKSTMETYAIHGSQISNLKILPYVHGTELMFSTGFDGSIYIYVLDKSLPFSGSISSRISFPEHRSWITGFVIDPEKKLGYSISNDRSLKIWPMAIEELLQKN